MSFDIALFDTRSRSESGVDFPILNPKSGLPFLDNEGKPVTITLLGRNSDAFRSVQREAQKREADRQARGVVRDDEEQRREVFDYLVAITKGWSFDALSGEPFAFNPANVRRLWIDGRWEWLRTQMFNHCLQEGNFLALPLPGSSGGPSNSSA